MSVLVIIFLVDNSRVSLARILFYQTMPRYTNFFENYNLIGIENQIISNFDINQISEDFIINRYQNIIGINDISILDNVTEDFTSYVSSFDLHFSYEDIEDLRNVNILLNRFFSMDSRTGIVDKYLDIDYFLTSNLQIEITNEPQVLIFHTHAASEFFIDSPNNINLDYGIVGVGSTLSYILTNTYGINVLHYRGVYDRIDGVVVRSGAYERIEPSIRNILENYPSIQLVLDLHRDGVPESSNPDLFRRNINGHETAMIMFVNGLSSINENGNIRNLSNIPNNYVRTNLALSFNLQMAFSNRFPGLTRRIYLTPFRYINHLRPLSSLVEVGTQISTMQEAHNAMQPLAYIIYSVVFANN
ncbi:MAG: stage II sporulation protein P [Defluviitaleaceae bacterium]|nr:stage II sporulation protein P [Defluviitaleaceae bacterium]